MDPQAELRDLTPEKEFLVAIDSDGCAFDTMEIKHKECFIPNIIKYWNLQAISKYARAAAEFVNLYSKWRGINRFPALTKAFDTDRKNYCAIASVKTNIGHLAGAAGVASLIKAVLALENKRIPPSINFDRPNPEIDFANSPFFVNTELADWKTDATPRRAGVSSG